MSSIVIVSVSMMIIGLLCTGIGLFLDAEGLMGFGAIVFVLSTFAGLLICGKLVPIDKNKTEIVNYEIIKTNYSVIVDTNKGMLRFTDMKYTNLTKNNTKVIYIKKLNSYNKPISEQLEIKRNKE